MTEKQEESTVKYYVREIVRGSLGTSKILKRGLTLEEAREEVAKYPDNEKTMVVFTKH